MRSPEFVHLHNHSEYSMSDGIIRFRDLNGGPSEFLRDLAKSAAKGIAMTDLGNMCGAIEFYSQCNIVGLNPIVGLEAYVAKGKRTDRGHAQGEDFHLTLLARNFEGYQNLMALSSKAYLEGFFHDPRIDRELLARHAKGLVVLSGCLKGELAQAALTGDIAGCVKLAASYQSLLEPNSYFIEIMDHGRAEEKAVIRVLLEVSRKTGIPLVATNDCRFVKKSDAEACHARRCIAAGQRMDAGAGFQSADCEHYFKLPAEMAALFAYAPEACANTLRIAEMCRLKIPMDRIIVPGFEVPKGHTQESWLKDLCAKGLGERFDGSIPAAYQDRLGHELADIKRLGLSGYFLIVWDLVRHARRQGIAVGPGRGAGAGSLAAYALKITGIDPVAHGLLFERFIDPDRGGVPDLDIDFAENCREPLIGYLRGKYGEDNVASPITFGGMYAKLAVRDVGRVMGTPLPAVERIAKLIPDLPGSRLCDAIGTVPKLTAARQDSRYGRLIDIALKLEGIKRHTGVHSAGVVITNESVIRHAPLARDHREIVTTQYDGNALSCLGVLRLDLLNLRALSVMDEAAKAIREHGEAGFDIGRIPMDDEKTFELLRSGKTRDVFQLDSQGIRDIMVRLKPKVFSDIPALITLYRPGPFLSGLVDMFGKRKSRPERIAYDSPLLAPILKDTYGCLLYQEQVMEISKMLAGFTPGEANGLRKALSRRAPATLAKLRDKFYRGGTAKGISQKTAERVYGLIEKFGGFGFNKSHAYAYGLLAYQSAYLKANHPCEFLDAVKK